MHPLKKAKTKRWHAIWHCSAQSELTTRLVHDAQNKAEILASQCGLTHSKDYPTFGSCPGMGHHDDGIDQVIAALKRLQCSSPTGELSTADGAIPLERPNSTFRSFCRRAFCRLTGTCTKPTGSALCRLAIPAPQRAIRS